MNHLLMHKIDVCLINFILFVNFSVANLFKQIFVNLKTVTYTKYFNFKVFS